MRNIIDELAVKHDMLAIMQGLNYFMLGNALMLDSMNLQKELHPDDELLENYIRFGFWCVVIHDSLKDYRSNLSEETLNELGDGYDMIMKQAKNLVGYMLINRAKVRTNIKTNHISIILMDNGVSVTIDETLMDGYAGFIIDYIDNALSTYGGRILMYQSESMVKEYNMICELSNRIEKDSQNSEV